MMFYSYSYEGKYTGKIKGDLCQITEARIKALKKEGKDPIEKKWIKPSFSTEVKPPKPSKGFESIFNGKTWIQKEIKVREDVKEEEYIPTDEEKTWMEMPSYAEFIKALCNDDLENFKKECQSVFKKYEKKK